jgi:hypothetical protein
MARCGLRHLPRRVHCRLVCDPQQHLAMARDALLPFGLRRFALSVATDRRTA